MVVIKCKECTGDVSSTAKACPHCGASVVANAGVSNNYLAILLGIGSLGSLITFFLFLSCIQSCAHGFVEVVKGVDPEFELYKSRAQMEERTTEENDVVVEPPLSDDVLGDEYKLRKGIYGAWEVYKGDVSTGFQAIDRNECLKWVKQLRGL